MQPIDRLQNAKYFQKRAGTDGEALYAPCSSSSSGAISMGLNDVPPGCLDFCPRTTKVRCIFQEHEQSLNALNFLMANAVPQIAIFLNIFRRTSCLVLIKQSLELTLPIFERWKISPRKRASGFSQRFQS
jgi:hypothetical protein